MYTEKDVETAVYEMLRKRRLRFDEITVSRAIDAIVERKKNRPTTARNAALIVVERLLTHQRRLAHGTGATGWL